MRKERGELEVREGAGEVNVGGGLLEKGGGQGKGG